MRGSLSHTCNAEVSRTVRVINKLPRQPTSLMATRFSASAPDYRGRWTQIFGSKDFGQRLLDRSRKAIFAYIWRPHWGWSQNCRCDIDLKFLLLHVLVYRNAFHSNKECRSAFNLLLTSIHTDVMKPCWQTKCYVLKNSDGNKYHKQPKEKGYRISSATVV